MQLFIANPTNQVEIVAYRLEFDREGNANPDRRFQPAKQQDIRPGQQAVVGGDLHPKNVAAIIKQLERYGLVRAGDLGSIKAGQKVSYIAGEGLAVPAAAIRKVERHNMGVKQEEGRERRAQAAVATNELVQTTVNQQFAEQGIPAQAADRTSIGIEQMDEDENQIGPRIEEGFDIAPEGKVGLQNGRPAARKGRRR